MKISLIIPAYNEEKRIKNILTSYLDYLKKIKYNYELIFVIEGEDSTLDIVKNLAKKNKNILYRYSKQKLGKGGAVKKGFRIASGDIIGFVDADNSVTSENFNKLLPYIKKYDCVISSRWMKDSIVKPKQPLSRRFVSRSFNLYIRLLFGFKVKDSQCGAKIFKKEVIRKILPDLQITNWAFDIELLFNTHKNNYSIKEVPIHWSDYLGSNLKIPRASIQMFLATSRLKLLHSPLKNLVKVYDKIYVLFH